MTLFGSQSRASYKVKHRTDRSTALQVESVRSGVSRGGGSTTTSQGWESMLNDRQKLKGAEAAIRAVMNDVKKRYEQVKNQEAKLQSEAHELESQKSDFNDRRDRALTDMQNERDELSQREADIDRTIATRSRRSDGGSQYTRSVARDAPRELPATEPKSYRSGDGTITVRSRSVTGRSSRRSGKKQLCGSARSGRTASRQSPATEPRYEPTKPPSYISNGSSKRLAKTQGSAKSSRQSSKGGKGGKDVLLFKQDKDGKFKLQKPSPEELEKILARATPCKPRKEKYMRDTPPTILGGRRRSKSVGGGSVQQSIRRTLASKARSSKRSSKRSQRTATRRSQSEQKYAESGVRSSRNLERGTGFEGSRRSVTARSVRSAAAASEASYGGRKKGYVSSRRSGYSRSRTARTPRSDRASDRYERRSARSARSDRRSAPPPPLSDRRDDRYDQGSVAESINSYRKSLEDRETRSVRSRGTRGRTAASVIRSERTARSARSARTPGSTAQTVPTTQIAQVVYNTVKNVVKNQNDLDAGVAGQAVGQAIGAAMGGVVDVA